MANRIDINSKTEFPNRATMKDFVELFETFVSITKSYNRSGEKRERTGGKKTTSRSMVGEKRSFY